MRRCPTRTLLADECDQTQIGLSGVYGSFAVSKAASAASWAFCKCSALAFIETSTFGRIWRKSTSGMSGWGRLSGKYLYGWRSYSINDGENTSKAYPKTNVWAVSQTESDASSGMLTSVCASRLATMSHHCTDLFWLMPR